MCGDYSCQYRNSHGRCTITACVKSVSNAVMNYNSQHNEMVMLPQTIGDITFYNKTELFDWIVEQQKINKYNYNQHNETNRNVIPLAKYENGKIVGFEIRYSNHWFDEAIKPDKFKWVVVKDKHGVEYPFYMWMGIGWYAFIGDKTGGYHGMKTNVEIVSWKYQ